MSNEIEKKLDGSADRPDQPNLTPDVELNENYKEAMAMFEKVQSTRRMGIGIDIAKLMAQIEPQQVNTQFPEKLFVQYFLPLFLGEAEPTESVNINTWTDKVAGDERRGVDIIDEDYNVLFTVPPMFDTSVFEQARPGSQSMTRIERAYSRLKEFDAAGSQNYLNKMLTGIHVASKPTEETYSNIRAWNAIMTRYGKADKIINLLPLDQDPNKDKVATPTPSATDLSDYELDTD